jgi:hypothetical protein
MKRKSEMKANIGMVALAMILSASLVLAAIPSGAVQASNGQIIPVTDEETPPISVREGREAGLLEKALRREMKINKSLSTLLKKADAAVIRLEEAITQGQANDRDVSALENELEKLTGQLIIARTAHERAADLLLNPAGFDANGQVINREIALESIKKIHQIQQEVRQAIGISLRDALRSLRDYHRDNSEN